jgi:hypothetical protein
MNNLKILFLSFLAGSLMFVSCEKGNAGAAGTAGAAGAAGVAGAAGAAGASGTDSILYSGSITLAMNPYFDTANGYNGYVDSIAAPALTQAVINQDIIIGYLYVPYGGAGDSAWVSIDNDANQEAELFPHLGLLVVEAYWSDFETFSGNRGDFTGMQFKYFIIPPSVLTPISQLTTVAPVAPDALKKMSYASAMTALGIKPSAAGNIGTAKTIH